MTPVAILDADVLFPMLLRDTLLRVASAGCYRPHWSERILDEMTRNLVSELGMEASKAKRIETLIRQEFEDALVVGWEPRESDMPNHVKDRHVTAAAVTVGAGIIVTRNVRHFRKLPDGLVAMSPDNFLIALVELQPEEVIEALTKQATSYHQPKASVIELLQWLSAQLPRFAAITLGLLSTAPWRDPTQ